MHVKLAALAVPLAAWVALAPRAARAAEALAVMPLAEPPGPDAALQELAGALRTALELRGSGGLSPETLRHRMTGTAPAEALAAADAAYQKALDVHAGGDFEGSIRALRAAVAELETLPPGAEVHARWSRAMLRLARSEQAVGRRSEARAVLERLLRADVAVEVDPRLYPPGFQRLVEEVRAETRALWTRKLAVEAEPGVRIFVDGREVAQGPAVLELPPGRYRLSGGSGEVRSPEVTVDLGAEDRSVRLDLSLAELLRPGDGPGLAVPAAERADRLAAVARFLDLDRLVTVRLEVEGDRTWAVAGLLDARRGGAPAEGRVRLVGGALPAGGADALAAFLLSGEPSPLVEPAPAVKLGPALPRVAERRGFLGWDHVKRPQARPYGWWATGAAVTGLALAVVSVTQFAQANRAYADARGMQAAGGGVSYGHSVADYNAAIRRGDRARTAGTVTAIGAGTLAASSIVLGIISYHRTGEIGPFRF